MTTNEEPEQERRRRDLPWLLLGSLALVLLVLADIGGWVVTRDEARAPRAVAGGKRLAPPRAVTGAAGGPVLSTDVLASAPVAVGRDLSVAAQVIGKLAPGRVRPLVITLHNTSTAAVSVTGLHVTVGQPADAACHAAWFTVTGNLPGRSTLRAGTSTTATLHLELRDEPVNQNGCKGLRVPFTITVDGARSGP